MIYASQKSAESWAAELNKRRGYHMVHAVRISGGWTVVIVKDTCTAAKGLDE